MSDYLPNDVMIGIFQWLPIKPLGRFMLVCKSWYTLISSPYFVSMNINQVYKNQSISEHKLVDGSNKFNELNWYISKQVYEMQIFYRKTCEVIGNANGLLCVCIDLFPSDPIIILWNPAIQKVLDLPKPSVTFSSHGKPYLDSFGFGYDPISNDFKIVRIVQFTDRQVKQEKWIQPTAEDRVVPPAIELFKLSTGEWQVLNNVILPFRIDGTCFYSLLNGNLHWVGYGEENKDAIVVFNLSNDEFELMMLPDHILSLGIIKKVDVFREYLALTIYQYSEYGGDLIMWIMKSYGDPHSWSELNQSEFKIDSCTPSYLPHGVDVEALITNHQLSASVDRQDMKVTLHQNYCIEPKVKYRTALLSLHKGLPTIRIYLEVSSVLQEERNFYMGSYFESLALLDKGISMCESFTCDIMPREEPEGVANDTKSIECGAKRKKKRNAKISEYVASLIKKNLLCNRF